MHLNRMKPSRSLVGSSVFSLFALVLLSGCAKKPEALPVCTASNSPRSICGLMNPEDIDQASASPWILISQMGHQDTNVEPEALPARPGNLMAFRVADAKRRTLFPPSRQAAGGDWETTSETSAAAGSGKDWGHPNCPGPPEAARFMPHGIAIGRHPSGATQVAVVNHGGREAVELFEWREGDPPGLQFRGCVPLPEGIMANDLALFEGGGFVVTKFLKQIQSIGPSAIWSGLKVAWGWQTGEVYRWQPGGDVVLVPGSGGSAPNGIALSKDERSIFISEWGGQRVTRIPLDPAAGPERKSVKLGHRPDNLSWASDGRLLATGQAGGLRQILGCSEIETGGCGLAYGVYAIDPESMEATEVHTGLGAGSIAVEVGYEIFVGAFTGDQIERIDAR